MVVNPGGSGESTSTSDVANCEGGVCSIDGNNGSSSAMEKVLAAEKEEKVSTIVALGYSEVDAKRALEKKSGSVEEAVDLLSEEDERREQVKKDAKELSDGPGGWSLEAATSALEETGSKEAAQKLLEEEESAMIATFEAATADMLESGWDEVVARQALLAQYNLDQARASGGNTTVAREVLDGIRPTLKKRDEPEAKAGGAAARKPQQPQQEEKRDKPKPANKEDVVFEVSAATFQQVVLESPVPVLVDVYADWCGPCKQLGPILEEAAVNSGGMFRLAKVNSDNERSISEALNVQGLPTVFSVNKGKFTDRFVGMLPQEQLQQFLVRCVTGFGERVQADEVSDDDLLESTRKLSSLAGLSSISFKKREKILSLVDQTIAMEGAVDPETGAMTPNLKVALLYISNAAGDVRSPKVTSINTGSKAFVERVNPSPAARRLLEVAGFRPQEKDVNGTMVHSLELMHANAAILTMVGQRAVDAVAERKFKSIKKSAVKLGDNKSFRVKKENAEAKEARADPTEATQIETGVAVSFQGLGGKSRKRFPPETPLGDALAQLLAGSQDHGWESLEIRHPLPRKPLNRGSPELGVRLEFWEGTGIVVGTEQLEAAGVEGSIEAALKKKKKRLSKAKKKGSVSLRSYDERDRGGQEAFGGAETVTIVGEESDDDAEVEFGEEEN